MSSPATQSCGWVSLASLKLCVWSLNKIWQACLALNPLSPSFSWSSAKQTQIQPMSMETHHCIMPASGATMTCLRLGLPLVVNPCKSSIFLRGVAYSTLSFTKDLVNSGAQVSICNKYGETPLDKAKPHLRTLLKGIVAVCHSSAEYSPFIKWIFMVLNI